MALRSATWAGSWTRWTSVQTVNGSCTGTIPCSRALTSSIRFRWTPSQGPRRISGLLPWNGRGDFRISADSQHVVYTAQQDTGGVWELYSVPIAGGQTVKLNSPLPTGGQVQSWSFEIDSSSERVFYIADQDVAGTLELFSVPIVGGVPIKLNGGLVTGGHVSRFEVDPLGNRVIYVADQQVDERYELFSAPAEGGPATKLNGPLATGTNVVDYDPDPLGQRVVYRVGLETDSHEIYSVPIHGGTATKLNGAMTPGGSVSAYAIDPLGQRVVYIADQQVDQRYELYSVPIGGGSAVKLSGTLADGGFVLDVSVSPLGDRVSYTAYQQGVVEVFTVGIAGGLSTKRNAPLAPEADVHGSGRFSPDGRWLIFEVRPGTGGRQLFRADVSTRETGTLLAKRMAPLSSYHFDPTSHRIVLLSHDDRSNEIWRPWSVPLEDPLDPTGAGLVPRAAFQPTADVNYVRVGSTGFVVYVADQETEDEFELFSVLPSPQSSLIFADGFESGDHTAW